MNYRVQQGFSNDSGVGEAEETLRLIARLPAPEGLEERVEAGLRSAPGAARRGARVLAWPGAFSPAAGWLRAAAAAAIVFVVAGGGWGIYSRVQPSEPAHGIAGPQMAAPGGFSEGGAVRRPQTLVGPVVTVPAPPATTKPKTPAKAAATGHKSAGVKRTVASPVAPAVQ
ncbi:MAG: hypothetical protein P4L26_05455 [Terracidiphilus sp.]|nr:hypothetical protein [Terracidiphilus sp.]